MYGNGKKPKARAGFVCVGPSRTKQSGSGEADINNIIARYLKTGIAPATESMRGSFYDVSRIGSYADVVRKVNSAEAAFRRLSAKIRTRFGNEPRQLIEFLQDEKNLEEAIKLGLVAEPKDVAKKDAEPAAPSGSPKPSVGKKSDKK